jgi:hypothetical protein
MTKRRRRTQLTQERLKAVLHYDSASGLFTWRTVLSNRVRAGQVAGGLNGDGYRLIMIDSVHYVASRLAWLWMTGHMPHHEVKHADGDPTNDRWENLRQGVGFLERVADALPPGRRPRPSSNRIKLRRFLLGRLRGNAGFLRPNFGNEIRECDAGFLRGILEQSDAGWI